MSNKSLESRFNSIASKKAFCNIIKCSERMMVSRGKDEEAYEDAKIAIEDFLRASTTISIEERDQIVSIFSTAMLNCWSS